VARYALVGLCVIGVVGSLLWGVFALVSGTWTDAVLCIIVAYGMMVMGAGHLLTAQEGRVASRELSRLRVLLADHNHPPAIRNRHGVGAPYSLPPPPPMRAAPETPPKRRLDNESVVVVWDAWVDKEPTTMESLLALLLSRGFEGATVRPDALYPVFVIGQAGIEVQWAVHRVRPTLGGAVQCSPASLQALFVTDGTPAVRTSLSTLVRAAERATNGAAWEQGIVKPQ
jgi:hypothetical protein